MIRKLTESQQCGAWKRLATVPERSTTWATPFQSLTASRPAEVVKWPMLIKREGGGEEAEHEGPLAGALSVRVKKG
jgi:hypothetical protein